MLTDEQARQILHDHGEQDIPARGKLRAELRIRAQQYLNEEDGPSAPLADEPAAAAEPDDGQVQAETPPRRSRAPRAGLAQRVRGQRGGPGGRKGKRAKPKHPRVPVDRLTGMAWDGLGRLFAPVSLPVGRTLQLQAPVAGLVLEDVVRDTAADRLLQPVARNMEKGRKVYALAGPPAIVFALELAQQLPPEQRALREAFLVPMLREALMAWDDVAADRLEEAMARQEQDGPRAERADRLIQMIFTPPVPPTTGGHAASDEDAEAARAQQMAGAM